MCYAEVNLFNRLVTHCPQSRREAEDGGRQARRERRLVELSGFCFPIRDDPIQGSLSLQVDIHIIGI